MSKNSEAANNKNEENFHKLLENGISDIKSQLSQIHNDIQYSITPKFLELSPEVNDLAEHAIELWRLERRLNKFLSNIPEDQKEVLHNSLRKLKRYLEKNDIDILDQTGQKYDDGMNLEILAVEKDPVLEHPIIKETKEPTILYKDQVIHPGKVIIANTEGNLNE